MPDIEPNEALAEGLYGKCGYTNDGFVFLITDSFDPDGNKIQATFTWTPTTAVKMAQDIANAAGEAAQFYNAAMKKRGKKK